MPRYSLFGLSLESVLSLPEVSPCRPEAAADLELERSDASGGECSWYQHLQSPEGSVWMSKGRGPGIYRILFPDLAEFTLSRDGRRTWYRPLGDTPDLTLRHLFLDHVMPLVLNLRGRLTVHAGAVQAPDGPIVITGDSGAGKSTLVAHMALHGFPLMGDDCIVLESRAEGYLLVPGYPTLRLWEDVATPLAGTDVPLDPVAHYSPKLRLSPPRAGLKSWLAPVPVTRMYLLAPLSEERPVAVSIEPVTAHGGFLELVGQVRVLDPEDRASLKRTFDQATDLAKRIRFFRLSYPRTLDALPAVADALRAHLAR